jgi:hypothetical protein
MKLLGVVLERRSYLNALYLLLAGVLGTAYFALLVAGFATGFGTLITLLGIPILLLTMGGAHILCRFERWLAIVLLGGEFPPETARPPIEGLWRRVRAHLSDRVTWTGLLHLWLKFPLGLFSLIVAAALLGVSAFCLTSLFWYSFTYTAVGLWQIDAWWEAVLLTLAGIPVLAGSLHVLNLLATASGWLAKALLSCH